MSFNTQVGEYSRVHLQIVVVHSTAEFFDPTGTGTVAKRGISERDPLFRFELESRATTDANAESLDVGGDTKKRQALSRSAFRVNQWAAKVRSRIKGSPCQTLFVTTRARPDSGSLETATLCKSSSPLRWIRGNQLSSNFLERG